MMKNCLVLTGSPPAFTLTEVRRRRDGATAKRLADTTWPDGRSGGPAVAVFPRRLLLVKRFSVPAVPAERLAKVVEIEADRHLVFPASECSLACLAWPGASGWEVLLAAAKRDDVAEYLSAVKARGFRQVRVIPSAIAIAFAVRGPAEDALLAVAVPEGVEVVRVDGGRVTASHFIDGDPGRLKAGMDLFLAAQAPGGEEEPLIRTVISGGPAAEEVAKSLAAFSEFAATRLSEDEDIAALGAAEAAFSKDAGLFDLARAGGLSAVAGERRAARLRRVLAGALAVAVLAGGYLVYQSGQDGARLGQVLAQRDGLRAQVAGIEEAWARQERNAGELASWASVVENRVSWAEALSELNAATPEGVSITDARFEKSKNFSLTGAAGSQEGLSAFLRGLEKTSWFAGASLGYARNRDQGKGNGGVVDFSVTGTLGGGRTP